MKHHLNPPDLFPSRQYGFSQIVTSTPGKMIFLSGQVAWDAAQRLHGENDLKEQALQALRNVKRGLAATGAAMSDITAMRLYIVDYAPEKFRAIQEALLATFAGMEPPACTWIGVAALANEGLLIEIEVMAVVSE